MLCSRVAGAVSELGYANYATPIDTKSWSVTYHTVHTVRILKVTISERVYHADFESHDFRMSEQCATHSWVACPCLELIVPVQT